MQVELRPRFNSPRKPLERCDKWERTRVRVQEGEQENKSSQDKNLYVLPIAVVREALVGVTLPIGRSASERLVVLKMPVKIVLLGHHSDALGAIARL